MAGIQNKVRIFVEKVNRKRFDSVIINEVAIYFMNSKEVFPFIELIRVLCNFRIEFFGDAVKREAVVGGEDKLLFKPEAFLKFFNVREKLMIWEAI